MSKITPLGQFTLFKLRTGPQHVKWSLATQKYQPMKIRGFLQWLLWLVVGPQSIFTEWPSIVDKYFSVGKHRHRSIKKIYINSNNNTRALLYGKLFKVPGGKKHRADWESAERKMFGSNPLENGLEKNPATSLQEYSIFQPQLLRCHNHAWWSQTRKERQPTQIVITLKYAIKSFDCVIFII